MADNAATGNAELETVTPPVQPVQTEEGRNTQFIRCTFCQSLVLKPKIASLVDHEATLPKISGQNEPEVLKAFWQVDDVFDFENCSFSKTVGTMKYLSCADCDIGPIGYQDLESKLCYVTTERITYTEK